MRNCEWARETMAWYANGSLPEAEVGELTGHLAACETCRQELSVMLRVKAVAEESFRAYPKLPDKAWDRVAAESLGRPVARLDVGSFLLGFSIGASVRRSGRVPVYGDLRVLGRKIRLFNVEQEAKP